MEQLDYIIILLCFILQVCKIEEKDLVYHCDVDKSFLFFG